MGAFILAFLVLVAGWALAFLVAFGEGMATAPHYTSTPLYVGLAGTAVAVVIAATHWLPHIGW